MASDEEDLSDALSENSTKNQCENTNKDISVVSYKCCAKKQCKAVVCVNCLSIFHVSCAKASNNLKIMGSNKIICCGESNQISKSIQEEIQTLKNENTKLREKNTLFEIKAAELQGEISNLKKKLNSQEYSKKEKNIAKGEETKLTIEMLQKSFENNFKHLSDEIRNLKIELNAQGKINKPDSQKSIPNKKDHTSIRSDKVNTKNSVIHKSYLDVTKDGQAQENGLQGEQTNLVEDTKRKLEEIINLENDKHDETKEESVQRKKPETHQIPTVDKNNGDKKKLKINMDWRNPGTSKQTCPIIQDDAKIPSVKLNNENLSSLENEQRIIANEIIQLNNDLNKDEHGDCEQDWKKVKNKRKSFKNLRGQGEDSEGNFKSENPRVWMFLHRVQKDVNEKHILEYLKKQTGKLDKDFSVKELRTNEGSRYKQFMVAADFEWKSRFYEPNFWPRGIGFKRFDFKLYYEKYNIRDVMKGEVEVARPNSFLETPMNTSEQRTVV